MSLSTTFLPQRARAAVSLDEFVPIIVKKTSSKKRTRTVDLTNIVSDDSADDVTIIQEHSISPLISTRKRRRTVIDLTRENESGIISIQRIIRPPEPLIVAQAKENALRRDRIPNPCYRAFKSMINQLLCLQYRMFTLALYYYVRKV